MKIRKAGFELLKEPTKTKLIERIARICYKSEDKIGEGTDKKMIENLLKRRHLAMLEHASSVFSMDAVLYHTFREIIAVWTGEYEEKGLDTQKSFLRMTATTPENGSGVRYLVSGNFRAWYEFAEFVQKRNQTTPNFGVCKQMEYALPFINQSVSGILAPFLNGTEEERKEKVVMCTAKNLIREITDFSELTDKERMVHERFSVLITTDRGITHEIVRMREASFAQESTRYVNYGKGKYGSEICVIAPFLFDEPDKKEAHDIWQDAMEHAEKAYMALTNLGIPPQWARTVLPHSTKVDIVVTANLEEWKHIFELRACDMTGPAHPQIKEVMVPLLIEMQPKYPFAFGELKAASVN